MLHCPEIRNQYLRKETKEIKLEAMNGRIKNYNRHVNVCPINKDSAIFESMSMWIKKARVFMIKTRNSRQKDMRNLLF